MHTRSLSHAHTRTQRTMVVKKTASAFSKIPMWAKIVAGVFVIAIIGLVIGLVVVGFSKSDAVTIVLPAETCLPLALFTATATTLTTTPQSYLDYLDKKEAAGKTFLTRPTTTASSPITTIDTPADYNSVAEVNEMFNAFLSGMSNKDNIALTGVADTTVMSWGFQRVTSTITDTTSSRPSIGGYVFAASSNLGFTESPAFCSPTGGAGSTGTPSAGASAPALPSWFHTL